MHAESSTPSWREALLVAALLAVVYLLTLTANHAEAEDALGYAAGIEDGDIRDVLHPHHLLWGALGWFTHNLALAAGHDGGSLGVLQVQNALTGAVGVGLLWWWLRSIRWGRVECATACGLLAFSYGYWFYSGEAEVYALSAVFLIGCLIAAQRAATTPGTRSFAVLGLANGLAVLAHDTNVLFAVVAVAALLLSRGSAPAPELIRRGAAYVLTAAALVTPAYTAAALANHRETPAQAVDWIGEFATSGEWGKVESSSVPKGAVGAGRAFVGGHFAFALDPVADRFESVESRNPREELFLMRDYPTALAGALLALTALLVILVVARVAQLWRAWGDLPPRTRAIVVLCLCWAGTYALFFTWWEPVNVEFWVATWVPLAILLAAPRRGGDDRRHVVQAAALVGVLAAVNLAGSMLPAQSEDDDYWHVRSDWYAAEARAGDLVVTNNYVQRNYVAYRSPAAVIDGELRHPSAVIANVRTWTEGRVLVSREAFDPGADEFSSCGGGDQCTRAGALRDHLLPTARVVARPPLESVWEIPPGRPAP